MSPQNDTIDLAARSSRTPEPEIDITKLDMQITTELSSESVNVEIVTAEIKTPDGSFVGEVNAHLIDRNSIRRGEFYDVMEMTASHIWEFGRLFNYYGLLNLEHTEHEFHKGKGCWEDLTTMSDSKWLVIGGIAVYVVSGMVFVHISLVYLQHRSG